MCKTILEKKKKSDGEDLILAIQNRSAQRAEQFNDFVARIEAKHCKPKMAKNKKKKRHL